MENYEIFYERLVSDIRKNSQLVNMIRLLNDSLTKIMYIIYPLLLIYLWRYGIRSQLMASLLVPGISFVLLSVVRKQLNIARPYEKWDIQPLIARTGKGQSFPSRHVFSATIISMCVLRVNIWLGIICLMLSMLLAYVRVLGGMHYPRDVIVGYMTGMSLGVMLFIV